MSGELCPYCSESVDVLLSLPCHSEHRLCETCLEQLTGPIGRAVSCPECREKFAWLNTKLLTVSYGELPKEQTCYPCRNQNKPGVAAEFFCQECQNPMCADCNQVHENFFIKFSADSKHASVDFQVYRKRADVITSRYCSGPNHERRERVICVCKNCRRISCVKCAPELCSCATLAPCLEDIEDYLKPKLAELCENERKLAEGAVKHTTNIKSVQDGMEELRVTCESIVNKIEQDFNVKVTELTEEKNELITNVQAHLQQTAQEVTSYLERSRKAQIELTKLADCMKPLIDLTHPAHLIEVYDEVVRKIREVVERHTEECVQLRTPIYLNDTESDNPSVIFPPDSISFVRSETLRNNAISYSVSADNDGSLYYQDSLKQPKLDPVVSIRRMDNGDIYVRTLDQLKRYTRSLSRNPNQPWNSVSYIKLPSSDQITHFAIFKESVVISRVDDEAKQLSIYNLLNGNLVDKITHPSLQKPAGVCINNQGDIFCTDVSNGSLFKTSLFNTTHVEEICSGLSYPSGVTLHRGLLYVLNNQGRIIFILTQKGELLKTLSIPDLEPSAHDISINDSGLVAIANRNHGIKIYQLTYFNPPTADLILTEE